MFGEEKEINMGTVIRPEVSKKNKYWIDRHRYYELKHFCLQYKTWKMMYAGLEGFSKKPSEDDIFTRSNIHGDPTAKCAISKQFYSTRIDMVENAAKEADPELGDYIFLTVTEGISYEHLKARYNIPCSKDTYYDRYRKFFWILDRTQKLQTTL